MYRGHATGGALIYLRWGRVFFFSFQVIPKNRKKERKKEWRRLLVVSYVLLIFYLDTFSVFTSCIRPYISPPFLPSSTTSQTCMHLDWAFAFAAANMCFLSSIEGGGGFCRSRLQIGGHVLPSVLLEEQNRTEQTPRSGPSYDIICKCARM